MHAHILLKQFLVKRSHLFGVVDEGDSVIGVVTLEDVLESLLGEEIVDELDIVVDMQQHARDQLERTPEDERPRSVGDPEEPQAS